jgi:hypothetical protein
MSDDTFPLSHTQSLVVVDQQRDQQRCATGVEVDRPGHWPVGGQRGHLADEFQQGPSRRPRRRVLTQRSARTSPLAVESSRGAGNPATGPKHLAGR